MFNEWYEPPPPPDPDAILYDDEEGGVVVDIPEWDEVPEFNEEPLERVLGLRGRP